MAENSDKKRRIVTPEIPVKNMRICLTFNGYRDSEYTRELVPELISHIKREYPKAELCVQIHPAVDWDFDELNLDWKLMVFCEPINPYEEERVHDELDEALARLGAKIWLPHGLPQDD